MERTGNTIGAEGRRQHNPDDPSQGDKPHRLEREADAEIDEALEGPPPEAEAQADGEPYGDDDVSAPEGVTPATKLRIEQETDEEV